MSIQIDPKTGLKIFNTRAAKATEKIKGKGYSLVEDEALTTLPEQPPGAVFNSDEQAKYREFKEARRGAADYMATTAATTNTTTTAAATTTDDKMSVVALVAAIAALQQQLLFLSLLQQLLLLSLNLRQLLLNTATD